MRIAFVLNRYFPFSGVARDFLRIANLCQSKGHEVEVYTMSWEGELPSFEVHVLKSKGFTNHGKLARFHKKLEIELRRKKYHCVVGFNKMPFLDVYFAADDCYLERHKQSNFIQKLNPRYRFYSGIENEVFGAHSKTICMMISDQQVEQFKKSYRGSDRSMVILPPGIDPGRKRPKDWLSIRKAFRRKHDLNDGDVLILMVGSGFKTKGVDRAINALASLPSSYRGHVRLMIVGKGSSDQYMRLARNKGVIEQVTFMGGVNNVSEFMIGADFLLHPSRKESAGMVLLEAIVSGLPVLVSGICGYAKHVKNARAGTVLDEPFSAPDLLTKLVEIIKVDKSSYVQNALNYAEKEDLYSLSVKAVEIIESLEHEHKSDD